MKKILVTGATDGIGFETAKLLAREGQHLLIHGRSKEKIQGTVTKIKSAFPNALVESYLADLSKFDDIFTG